MPNDLLRPDAKIKMNIKKTKAQIKMMETIMVMFVLFAILVIAIIFFFNFQKGGIQEQASQNNGAKAVEVSQFVSSMIELQCSQEDIRDFNCFDLYRMEHFKELSYEKGYRDNYYFDILGDSVVKVEMIYPQYTEWVLYNRTLSGDRARFFTPISLYNATDDTYAFGMLTVDYYG